MHLPLQNLEAKGWLVWTWLKAVVSETFFTVWWTLSILSTLSTFFFHDWASKWRLALVISAAVGFAWANFRVFRKQHAEISALRSHNQLSQARTSDLKIAVDTGSQYILRPAQNMQDFNAMYLIFHLMIENRGNRRSIIDKFQVEIIELGRTLTGLEPQEGLLGIQGRHCMYGMDSHGILSKTRLIQIEPEGATDRGRLIFYIPDVNLQLFAEANLRMEGAQRKFPPLHCHLTLTDTSQACASETFEMFEG